MNKVRTRIAPSPTGIPHIGNTRTALYDYLLAKKYKGKFVLRLEDTDQKRLVKGAAEKINEIMGFLGLTPDESPVLGGPYAPYVQTERLYLYQKYAKELVDKGVAYEKEGAIRFDMPHEGYTTWQDLVQGKMSIPNKMVDDKVLLKSDGIPTYHLASVVDDHLMEITHVLRGVEYLSSAPLHFEMYKALGWQPPVFAHVALLLGPDRSKLSKRHGAKNALEYRDDGYLPEALDNFMFYLGYSYHDNSEVLTLEEMVKVFDENKLQKQNAIFDLQKLDYFNKQWIRRLSDQELARRIFERYSKSKQWKSNWPSESGGLEIYLPLIKERIITLKDALNFLTQFFDMPGSNYEETSGLGQETFRTNVGLATTSLKELGQWDTTALEEKLRADVAQKSLKAGEYFSSIRAAITGAKVSPPLFDTLNLLGREETLKRLQAAI